MQTKKICVVTGTRAEYGLLTPLMWKIEQDIATELQVIATGMHLSPEFGLTYRQIEEDGFIVNQKVEMLLSSDTPVGVAKSIGLGVIGFSDVLTQLKPDMLVVLGDRFEMLAAAQAAMILRVPIAHIHGGEVTFGAYDDQIRHAITKMSFLHFTATEEYRQRVIRLGEHPERVYNVGAAGVDNIVSLPLLTKEEMETSLDLQFKEPLFLITQHPVTLSENPIEGIEELLAVLDKYPNATKIFTKANADDSGRRINQLILDFASVHKHSRVFDSLGSLRYLSLLKYADVVIGNSSSGILEAPYLKTPTVNIGDRQRGRVKADSVLDCSPHEASIKNAIEKALSFNFNQEKNYELYGTGNAANKIFEVIKNCKINSTMKEFFDGGII